MSTPFVPLYDWCKFWSNMYVNSGYIAHWNMDTLPILYNGNFRCHGNVCSFFGSMPISIFHKFNYITSITYKIAKISKLPWPLTIIWPWPWVWPLTLTIWRNTFISFFLKSSDVKTCSQPGVSITSGSKVMAHYVIFTDFIEVKWRKNLTSFCNQPEISTTSG